MNDFLAAAWVEFRTQSFGAEISIAGPPDAVVSLADDLPNDLYNPAQVYVDPGDGHYHLWNAEMLRNVDGDWQWR